MPKDKTGTYKVCIALVGVCQNCGEAVRFVITKEEAKILWKSYKLPPKDRNLWVETQMKKLKERGVVA